ncbi:hypothetical protein VP01_457g10 [Puccinia sorghi]|uniref:Splicing factor cactin central domain-containing protein n=1 Tax=Puccinia sorghi TaxID=27349 RepID=A0A0L6UNM7_9BASI|nr:hypothetical protein VP01_457g10 [Puccinia sorghi]
MDIRDVGSILTGHIFSSEFCNFQLKQAQKHAKIQVQEKRAKSINLLALNLKWREGLLGQGWKWIWMSPTLAQLTLEQHLAHDALQASATIQDQITWLLEGKNYNQLGIRKLC